MATYPEGIFFNKPRQGAPEFVRGSISIKAEQAIPFIEKHKNEKGYVNLDVLLGKDGIYLTLNEWKKPESKPFEPISASEAEIRAEEVYRKF